MINKSKSQMKEERKKKTVDNDLLNACNTEHFKNEPEEYSGGKAYAAFLKLFYKGEKNND